MAPAPVTEPAITVSIPLDADDNVPSTLSMASPPFSVTLLSIVTLMPEEIITWSEIIVKGGTEPPHVVVLLQLPEATAVNVAPDENDVVNNSSVIAITPALSIFFFHDDFNFVVFKYRTK